MQYPKIDTDWKYDTFPPMTLILKETIVAARNTEKNNNRNCPLSTSQNLYFR